MIHSLRKLHPMIRSLFFFSVLLSGALLGALSRNCLGAEERLFGDNVRLRGNLDNSRLTFTQKKEGHVAFIGGSITEMDGYRPMVAEGLKKRFPETKFTFT